MSAKGMMRGLWSLVVCCTLGGLSEATLAKERRVDSARCKEIAARIVERTNARFDHFSPSGTGVFFDRPRFVLSCTSYRLTGVSLTWDNAFPPNSWFEILARGGEAVTGSPANTLETASRKCYKSALRSKDGAEELDIPNVAKIECSAFTQNGGGVVIHIWVNDHEARKGIEDPS
ncbi:hypothetical protein [Bradyrhizobium sp. AZCC 1721]|uniref:hypothetical protein n=1 Tax=Bradyrhizobium sp. AZCC 1721 TaxID=3117016 RepID=UPI002FF3A5A9